MSNNEMTTNVFVLKTTKPVFCTSYPFMFIMGFSPEKSINWTTKTRLSKTSRPQIHMKLKNNLIFAVFPK